MCVRSAIQGVALQHDGHYGYRRITAELRRTGMLVNHKRVSRILREDSLIVAAFAEPRKKPRPDMMVNLAGGMHVTGINQLWVADITHVRLKRKFVFLAVVLDKFSRRMVGWSLDRNLTSRLTLAALRAAIVNRRPGPGLVHHSDRGRQYVHSGYVRLLHKHGMVASVSRPDRPGDNGNCESFFRTVKREEVEAKGYADFEDLRANITRFIERYYNACRSSLRSLIYSTRRFEGGGFRVGCLPSRSPKCGQGRAISSLCWRTEHLRRQQLCGTHLKTSKRQYAWPMVRLDSRRSCWTSPKGHYNR